MSVGAILVGAALFLLFQVVLWTAGPAAFVMLLATFLVAGGLSLWVVPALWQRWRR